MNKKKVCIVNYGVGNIQSIINMLNNLGFDFLVSNNSKDIELSSFVILPGVGNFFSAMSMLHKNGLVEVIQKRGERGLPLLGICLGMHLFFERSFEGKSIKGLNLLKGSLKKIDIDINLNRYVPHIGWHNANNFELINYKTRFKQKFKNTRYYFLHSYYLTSFEKNLCTLEVDYSIKIPAIIQKNQ